MIGNKVGIGDHTGAPSVGIGSQLRLVPGQVPQPADHRSGVKAGSLQPC